MERQIQKTGKRPWAGEDFIKLQNQLYDAIEKPLAHFNKNFVITGCEQSGSGPFNISEGLVFIDGKICVFDGLTGVSSFPIYINKQELETDNKTYGDLVDRATELHCKAVVGNDSVPYIELPVSQNAVGLDSLISPRSDMYALNLSSVSASTKATNNLHKALKPSEVVSATTSLAIIKYRIHSNIVQVKIEFPTSSPTLGATIFTFPADYRPTDDILVPVGVGGTFKIAANGILSLQDGYLSAVPGNHFYFEFPKF
jgi:hypothetical protein